MDSGALTAWREPVFAITATHPGARVPKGPAKLSAAAAVIRIGAAQASTTAFDTLDVAGDEATGANVLRVALDASLKQIAVNAGLEAGVVVEKVRRLPIGHGLNAATGQTRLPKLVGIFRG